jgi:uncharacterized protein YbjT (DUF2867 family)
MEHQLVTVFGGTGFLGRRVTRHLREKGFLVRVASRHPERAAKLFGTGDTRLESIAVDVHHEAAVAEAVSDAWGVVNAVSLYTEHGKTTFKSVHVEAAKRIAGLAGSRGVKRLVHVSGIGANPRSSSSYIRSRGLGELAVQEAFGDVTLIRPAVMFGPDDAFLTAIMRIVRWLPTFPMFGKGHTRLQPVYVEDIGEAVALALQDHDTCASTFELGGPRVYNYADLVTVVAHGIDKRPIFIPVPFAAWHLLAHLSEFLPGPPLTRNQVELMEIDNIAGQEMPGFARLNIVPQSVEEILPDIVRQASAT